MQFLHNKEKARGLGIVFLQRKSNRSAGTGPVITIVETIAPCVTEGIKFLFSRVGKIDLVEKFPNDGTGEAAAGQKTKHLLPLFPRIILPGEHAQLVIESATGGFEFEISGLFERGFDMFRRQPPISEPQPDQPGAASACGKRMGKILRKQFIIEVTATAALGHRGLRLLNSHSRPSEFRKQLPLRIGTNTEQSHRPLQRCNTTFPRVT